MDHRPWLVEEIAKAGVWRTDQAPENPEHNRNTEEIAGPHMRRQEVLFGKVSNGKGHHHNPMSHAHQRVPDTDESWHFIHSGLNLIGGKKVKSLISSPNLLIR